ncbi:hypothetical protein BJV74DRAFT_797556 [Russula compacta]|nr:hypothetical protein BJV74DRAFT_797556 [Russula compacta]
MRVGSGAGSPSHPFGPASSLRGVTRSGSDSTKGRDAGAGCDWPLLVLGGWPGLGLVRDRAFELEGQVWSPWTGVQFNNQYSVARAQIRSVSCQSHTTAHWRRGKGRCKDNGWPICAPQVTALSSYYGKHSDSGWDTPETRPALSPAWVNPSHHFLARETIGTFWVSSETGRRATTSLASDELTAWTTN